MILTCSRRVASWTKIHHLNVSKIIIFTTVHFAQTNTIHPFKYLYHAKRGCKYKEMKSESPIRAVFAHDLSPTRVENHSLERRSLIALWDQPCSSLHRLRLDQLGSASHFGGYLPTRSITNGARFRVQSGHRQRPWGSELNSSDISIHLSWIV